MIRNTLVFVKFMMDLPYSPEYPFCLPAVLMLLPNSTSQLPATDIVL